VDPILRTGQRQVEAIRISVDHPTKRPQLKLRAQIGVSIVTDEYLLVGLKPVENRYPGRGLGVVGVEKIRVGKVGKRIAGETHDVVRHI